MGEDTREGEGEPESRFHHCEATGGCPGEREGAGAPGGRAGAKTGPRTRARGVLQEWAAKRGVSQGVGKQAGLRIHSSTFFLTWVLC